MQAVPGSVRPEDLPVLCDTRALMVQAGDQDIPVDRRGPRSQLTPWRLHPGDLREERQQVGPDNLLVVNLDRCTGCGTCTPICPRNIISRVLPGGPAGAKYFDLCGYIL